MESTEAYELIVAEAHELGYVKGRTLAQYHEPMDTGDGQLYIFPAIECDTLGSESLYDISNFRVISRDPEFGPGSGVYRVRNSYGDEYVAITAEISDYVRANIEWLADSAAVLDHDDYYELEDEYIRDAWEDYGRGDLRTELKRAGYDTHGVTASAIDNAWDKVSMDQDIRAEVENTNSVYWSGMGDPETIDAMAKELSLK